MEPETGRSSGEETSRGNLYSSGRVKGCLHHVEGECDTRAFLRRLSIITSPTSHKNDDFLATGSRLSRLFPIASVHFACVTYTYACINII